MPAIIATWICVNSPSQGQSTEKRTTESKDH